MPTEQLRIAILVLLFCFTIATGAEERVRNFDKTIQRQDGPESVCFHKEYKDPIFGFSMYRTKCVPNQFISQSPSPAPTTRPDAFTCFFGVSNTNGGSNENTDKSCSFTACAGEIFSATMCSPYGDCVGFPVMSLYQGTTQVAVSEEWCGYCPTIGEYIVQLEELCDTYTLWIGCTEMNGCSGNVYVSFTTSVA
ncbi:hypothetical protein EON65_28320 [archaeon]|nr:MAG: hypothetical protein EON65_28320 [archaeon]